MCAYYSGDHLVEFTVIPNHTQLFRIGIYSLIKQNRLPDALIVWLNNISRAFSIQVTSTTKKEFLKCSCNHLTSFGGSLLIEPNPVDFDKVLVEFKRLDQSGNVTVLITVVMMFIVYFVVVLIMRRVDKNDLKKVVAFSRILNSHSKRNNF